MPATTIFRMLSFKAILTSVLLLVSLVLATVPRTAYGAPGDVLWTYPLSGQVYSSPVVDEDGVIYVTDKNLHAVDPFGQRFWVYSASQSLGCSPSLANDALYIACGNLHAISTQGSPLWTYAVSEWAHNPPAIAPDGTILFGARYMYAVNPDGSELWTSTTFRRTNTPTTVAADGTSYISVDGRILAFSATGALLWSFAGGALSESSPIIDGEGYVIAPVDNILYRLGPGGTVDWSFTAPDVLGSPAIGTDGTIYIGCRNGNLYALSADGALAWQFSTGGKVDSSPAVGDDDTVYFGSDDRNIYAVRDGIEMWQVATSGAVKSSPAIAPDGTLYVAAPYELFAIESGSAGLASSAWPMYRGNLARNGRSETGGESQQLGSVAGSVTNAVTGAFLAARVYAINAVTSVATKSDRTTGAYLFENLPPGSYDIKTSKFGYVTLIVGVNVTGGQQTTYNPHLVPK